MSPRGGKANSGMDQGTRAHMSSVYFYHFLSQLPPYQSMAAQSWEPTHPQGTRASSPGSQDPLPELASRGRGQLEWASGGPLTLHASPLQYRQLRAGHSVQQPPRQPQLHGPAPPLGREPPPGPGSAGAGHPETLQGRGNLLAATGPPLQGGPEEASRRPPRGPHTALRPSLSASTCSDRKGFLKKQGRDSRVRTG